MTTTTDLDSWLAAIEGEKCGRCKGRGRLNVIGNAVDCPDCHGKGRIWPILLWEVCGPLSDWCEEHGDYVRAKLVRPTQRFPPFTLNPGRTPSISHTPYGVHDEWYWRWLPDSKGDEQHLPLHEAARRLLLLWRKPCEKCGETGRMAKALYSSRAKEDWPKCETCSGCGYFSQQLVVGDGPVEVPESVAKCPKHEELLLTRWHDDHWLTPVCRYCPTLVEPAIQWAANHLLRVPKEVLT